MQSYSPEAVETVALVPLDETVTAISGAGGTALNALDNTNVVFAAGAVTTTKAIRLTELPVDEFAGDFEALPGPFHNGRIPLGFVSFEPDGTNFEADAVWTIDYDGPLPVGTYVPCFYWLEDEARWGEPVDGEVVDLGNGKKGLRATLPHFSAYGFAAPPPDPPQPPQSDDEDNDEREPNEPDDNPDSPNNDSDCGSQINLMSGQLCQTFRTLPLPSVGGQQTQVWAKYRSLDLGEIQPISTTFKQVPGSVSPDSKAWTVSVAGHTYKGTGRDVNVPWNGLTASRIGKTAKAAHIPSMSYAHIQALWGFNTNSGLVQYETTITKNVKVRRDDLSPFGRGWFGPYDTLLVDRGERVTIIQSDGRYLLFQKDAKGQYISPKGDFSTLTKDAKGYVRTFRNGTVWRFNPDGRLLSMLDRYGNGQTILYESNGQTVAEGEWGLTTRIRRITDSSGNTFDFAYKNGWLALLTDSAGRSYVFEHDSAGFLTAITDPLGQKEHFSYDERGMMTSHTDQRGAETTYTLDDRGRLLSRTWPTGTDLTVTYTEAQVGGQL